MLSNVANSLKQRGNPIFIAVLPFKIIAMNTIKLNRIIITAVSLLMGYNATQAQAANASGKIRFTSFTVHSTPKRVLIDWATDNTVSTNYFEIERSSDGVNFKTVALVMGPDPTQSKCDCYEGFDKPAASAKKYFYRLKHVSTDGEVELSEMKMLAVK
jgi:hypothetical protein